MEDASSPGVRTLRRDQPASPADPKPIWKFDGLGFRSVSQSRPWVLAVILLCAATIWGYTCIGPAGRLLPGRTHEHRTDFTVFTEAGAAFFDGRNPYAVTNPRGWHYLYPPLFALLVAPLSLFDTESQVLVWYALNVAFMFGCIAESRRLWKTFVKGNRREHRWIIACAFLAVMLSFFDCMQAGQLGIAIAYLLMLGCRLVLTSTNRLIPFLGGLILALPASVKLVPALPVVFLLGQQWLAVFFPIRGNRPWSRAITSSAGVASGAILFLLLIPASLIGWQKNLHSLDVWQKQIVMNERVGADASFNVHSYRNQSLTNGVYLWSKSTIGTKPTPVSTSVLTNPRSVSTIDPEVRVANPAVRVVIGFLLIVLLAVAARVGRRNEGIDAFASFGLASCATLLVSPLAWGHYFMVQLPALLCVPIWLSRRSMPRAAITAAVIPAILSWSYYLAMPQFGGLGLLGIGTAGWFLTACVLILWAELSGARDLGADSSTENHHARLPSRPHKLRHQQAEV